MHYLKTKYYFINKFDTKNINKLNKDTTVIYRNYKPNKDYEKIILKIKYYCKKKQIKFYLSNDVKLANKLKLDGAYIPSFNKSLNHLSYRFNKKFKIVGSAHNLKEINIKTIKMLNKFSYHLYSKKIKIILVSTNLS